MIQRGRAFGSSLARRSVQLTDQEQAVLRRHSALIEAIEARFRADLVQAALSTLPKRGRHSRDGGVEVKGAVGTWCAHVYPLARKRVAMDLARFGSCDYGAVLAKLLDAFPLVVKHPGRGRRAKASTHEIRRAVKLYYEILLALDAVRVMGRVAQSRGRAYRTSLLARLAPDLSPMEREALVRGPGGEFAKALETEHRGLLLRHHAPNLTPGALLYRSDSVFAAELAVHGTPISARSLIYRHAPQDKARREEHASTLARSLPERERAEFLASARAVSLANMEVSVERSGKRKRAYRWKEGRLMKDPHGRVIRDTKTNRPLRKAILAPIGSHRDGVLRPASS